MVPSPQGAVTSSIEPSALKAAECPLTWGPIVVFDFDKLVHAGVDFGQDLVISRAYRSDENAAAPAWLS